MTQISIRGPKKEEIGEKKEEKKDSVDQEVETINENSVFSFNILRPTIEIRKGMSQLPITPDEISRNSKFLKRLINDFLFTLEKLKQKMPRTLQIDENFILR